VVNAGNTWLDVLLHNKQTTRDILHTHQNIWGGAAFEWIYVGPTEDSPFRAPLVAHLAAAMPGKLGIGRFCANWAGIIIAPLLPLAHLHSFWTESLLDALIQQGYAFVLGVLYAYWLAKSRSTLAPILAHNITDGLTGAFWALSIVQS
jgi:hypothetical protein